MKLIILAENYHQMSPNSGMDPFFREFEKKEIQIMRLSNFDIPSQNFFFKLFREIKLVKGLLPRSSFSPHNRWVHQYAAFNLIKILKKKRESKLLLSDLENQYTDLFVKLNKDIKFRISGIAHQPPSWYKINGIRFEEYDGLEAIFVFTEEQRLFFQQKLKTPVVKILHGVDVDFFRPNLEIHRNKNIILFVGSWQRDFKLLKEVFNLVKSKIKEIELHCIIPLEHRNQNDLLSLANHPDVYFFNNLSAEELRDKYWSCGVVILPLLKSTANNSMLEAIATQTPVVINDTNGENFYAELVWDGVKYCKSNAVDMSDVIFSILKSNAPGGFKVNNLNYLKWQNSTDTILKTLRY